MKRLHLFEWEDQSWFPSIIRNYGTDFLQFVAHQFDFYKGVTDIIQKGLEKSGTNTIIDLASGGGGGWVKLAGHLQKEIPNLKVILTDYYPNTPAFEQIVQQNEKVFSYEKASVNALEVPPKLKGLRTQFLSFHHFKPKDAQQILQNAVNHQAPIAIFEAQERSIAHLIQFFFSPINVLLMTPFIRPFSLSRLLFTYILPIVPLFVWWDGLVSVLRTYSIAELKAMTEQIENGDRYVWEIGRRKNGPITIPYLLGYPK